MTVSKDIFLDTNILIYQTFEDFDQEKHQYVCRLLEFLAKNNYKIYISSQVLKEFLAILTNGKFFKRPLEIQEAIAKMEEFRKNFRVLYDSDSSIERLRDIVANYKIKKQKVHDANIVATMIASNIKNIATFDTKDFKFYKEINLFEIKEKMDISAEKL